MALNMCTNSCHHATSPASPYSSFQHIKTLPVQLPELNTFRSGRDSDRQKQQNPFELTKENFN